MTEKIIGYSLLGIGILTIIVSVYSVYLVFSKQSQPISPFHFESISIDLSSVITSSLPGGFELPSVRPIQKTEIMPASILNQIANTIAHLLLMGFIASGGTKLAGIGVMLLRPIHVKVNTTSNQTDKT